MLARKAALITGIGGQDGAYLAQLLVNKDYKVFGTSRDAGSSHFDSLVRLGIADQVSPLSMAPNDFKSTLSIIMKACPDEIYHLAGQTSVGLSFEQPSEAIESITIGTLNILEAQHSRSIAFLGNAGTALSCKFQRMFWRSRRSASGRKFHP